ncbi:MAG: hypothetical protein WCP07_07270 [bacterium]
MTIPLARDWLYTPERGFFRVRRHGQFYALYRPDEGDFSILVDFTFVSTVQRFDRFSAGADAR